MSLPGLVSYGIFTFLGAYNALLWPLIVTQSPEMRTVQLGLLAFVSEAGSDYGALMAASAFVIAPWSWATSWPSGSSSRGSPARG
ncbi:ABC transporter [Thermus thermophilus]|nr:ABC transporter [Thermus thermophilus]